MTTATRSAPIDISQFPSLFHDLGEQLVNLNYEPVMIASLELIAEGEQAAFDGARTPGGIAWKENAPAAIKRKGHGIVLFESGSLENSLVEVEAPHNIHETSHRGLLFGTDIEYSIFHQDGTSRIPQREHVGMNDNLLDAIAGEIADFTVEQLRG